MKEGWGLDHDGSVSISRGAVGTVADEFLLSNGEQDQGRTIDKKLPGTI